MASGLSFALNLVDGMSNPAHAGAASIRGVSSALKQAKADLSSYQAQLGRAKQLGDIEGYRKYSGLADSARRDVFELTQQTEGLTVANYGLAGSLGPVGTGLAYAAGAAVALGAGIAALTYKALELAESETEARIQAVTLFDALGDGSAGAGERTLSMIDDIGRSLPQTRKQLVGWAKELEALGITDLGEVRGQLQAMASAQALAGESGAEAYEKLIRKVHTFAELGQGLKLPARGLGSLAETGVHVSEVAREMGISVSLLGAQLKHGTADATKFGAALESAVLKKGAGPLGVIQTELSTILVKGAEGFKHLFDDVDFLPLSSQLSHLFELFDDGPDHSNTFKEGITGALNSIVKGLALFAEEAEHDFLQVEIFALENKKALDELWTGIGIGGKVALSAIAEIAREMGNFLRYGLKAVEVAEKLISLGGGRVDGSEASGTEIQRYGAAGPVGRSGPGFAPANAEGGVVGKPAPGEFFASVAPGERIVPKDQPANDNSSGVTIHELHVHVDAPHGVTDATMVTAGALALALERFQLGQGR